MLDIERWRDFSEIDKIDNDKFWRKMEEIGDSHALQYKLKV